MPQSPIGGPGLDPQVPPRKHQESGASLVEYALLVALIAVVCFAAVTFFGSETDDTFSRVGVSVTNS